MARVFDKGGTERDWAWLTATYGNVEVSPAAAGQAFRLVAIFETEGPANIKCEVRNESGGPQASQPVVNYWPNNDGPDLTGGGLKTLPYPKALFQRTDANGITGFGISTGSYYTPPDVGPHTLWVGSPSLPSDVVAGIGMLPNTEHRGPLHLVWQIAEAGEAPGEPEDPGGQDPVEGTVRDLLLAARAQAAEASTWYTGIIEKLDGALALLG